ncbi:hypothetical protein IC744_04110 [Microbacterium hominis]|uniref:hypothetical protein n=1 Tax=Microbacterium TaxID=33882 RepID=UPI00168AB119|nr:MULTISPECIES: hypothetical protein [Microbacterium]QOC25562.1 hypothetical protein IC745_14765 [Microbacterium hominis]QOC29563.1 hypothetical protein IC744_04110 [Microbacterium hominis]QYF98064.1 hypothetical protein KY498_02050 [Microbacterium sp. PAMC21962]
MSRIEGKVVTVLNERELVLNVGSEEGVKVGMRFKILYPDGIEITDPDAGAQLGSVEWPKTEVKTVNVQPHMAIGRTFRTITIPESGSRFGGFRSALYGVGLDDYMPEKQAVETSRSSDGFAAKQLDPSDSVVK